MRSSMLIAGLVLLLLGTGPALGLDRLVSCPQRSLHLAANAADKQATENNSVWPENEVAALAANFGFGSPGSPDLSGAEQSSFVRVATPVAMPWPGLRSDRPRPMTRIQAHPVGCVFSVDQCHYAAEAAGYRNYRVMMEPRFCPMEPHLLCLGFH